MEGSLRADATVRGTWPALASEGRLLGTDVRLGADGARRVEATWRVVDALSDASPLAARVAIDTATLAGRRVDRATVELQGSVANHRLEALVDSAALPPAWIESVDLRTAATAASAGSAALPTTARVTTPVGSIATQTGTATGTATETATAAATATATATASSHTTATATATATPSPRQPRTGPASPSATAALPAVGTDPAALRSRLSLAADGGFVPIAGERAGGWRGTLREVTARPVGSGATAPAASSAAGRPWFAVRDVRGGAEWAGDALRVTVEPGRADALGAGIRWQRIAWQGAGASGTPARLDAQASIDPIAVAPLLARWQPDFGWGGTLAVGARLDVRSSPSVRVDAAIERAGGDLTVTDELGTRPLGLDTLRLAVVAENGTWRFTQAVGGSTLGSAGGTVTARTSATATWPDAATPIDGSVTLRVADLGAWGTWVPAGWRIRGTLAADAAIGGRFDAPTYTGRVQGNDLGVRNFVQGVDVKDGSIAVALQGETARIERFVAHAGSGTLSLQGNASLGESPRAELALVADRFQVLGRVDRRIVTSGRGTLSIDRQTLAVGGRFGVDEGLIDFTKSDAPTLGDDVVVVRRGARSASGLASAAREGSAGGSGGGSGGGAPNRERAAGAASPPRDVQAGPEATRVVRAPSPPRVPASALVAVPVPPSERAVVLDLGVGMGERLRVRGRGLDARLAGDLRITSPNGRLAVTGTVSAVDGTYQAYGQRLQIDRALLVFTGPVENPRLDIEATRPNLDVRVGVAVSGTALSPRIRLFSEPDMTDTEKLSWLVLGREGAGAESALVQQAALALLSGEGPGLTDRFTQAIGLDSVSVRQADGTVRDTIVSLGKQISARWYVGYERGLNTATGSWQLVYRVARRLTVRAQAGSDNAVDLIWTLRWK
ncbi:MAG TPA: translocation/assembly module TamB domain-containing protein [Actinomycetales bacterium]